MSFRSHFFALSATFFRSLLLNLPSILMLLFFWVTLNMYVLYHIYSSKEILHCCHPFSREEYDFSAVHISFPSLLFIIHPWHTLLIISLFDVCDKLRVLVQQIKGHSVFPSSLYALLLFFWVILNVLSRTTYTP
ncbi:hypothetical protein DFS34DRAFT_320819 [Phlyctochytrium arcticum]|nr:hypothetical protein DFS34DRAFT_320819 [Phlyctochytrium arcticum]